jgi:hypothetical protein
MRAPDRISRIAGGRRADVLVALGLTAFLLIYLIARGMLHSANNLLETGCGLGVFGCVIVRRSHPQVAAVVAGGWLPDGSRPGIVRGLSRQPDPGACPVACLLAGNCR